MLQICENIRQARVSGGLSQQELADKIGVERATYKNWEDKTEPSLSIIKSIAEHLDIPEASLLVGVIDLSPKQIAKANEESRQMFITEVAVSLNRLTLAIGRLSGLSKEETEALFPSPLGKKVFEDMRKRKDKSSGGSKRGKG